MVSILGHGYAVNGQFVTLGGPFVVLPLARLPDSWVLARCPLPQWNIKQRGH